MFLTWRRLRLVTPDAESSGSTGNSANLEISNVCGNTLWMQHGTLHTCFDCRHVYLCPIFGTIRWVYSSAWSQQLEQAKHQGHSPAPGPIMSKRGKQLASGDASANQKACVWCTNTSSNRHNLSASSTYLHGWCRRSM